MDWTGREDGMNLVLPFWNFIVGDPTGVPNANPGNTPKLRITCIYLFMYLFIHVFIYLFIHVFS